MGIHDFFKIKITNEKSKFHGKTIDDIGETVDIKSMKNKTVCIDASLTIYQSILSLNLTDKSGKTTSHINTILNKILLYNKSGINQIWIFDSPVINPLKANEIKKRDETRKYKLNSEHVNDIKKLLDLMGIMYITAPEEVEAEKYGAWLTKHGLYDYMLSGDSDVLLFGGNLLRIKLEFTKNGKTKKTIYKKYILQDILNDLEMKYEDFVKMGILMGTDYNSKQPGVGAARIMQKYKNYDLNEEMKKSYDYYVGDIDASKTIIKQETYNKEKLIEYLTSMDFNKENLEKKLKNYNS